MAYLSLQYVKSMNCIVSSRIGALGGGWSYGPMTQNMSSLNLAL